MRIFHTIEEIHAAVGEDLGATDWVEVTQAMVSGFADITRDHNWIHVDVDRARASPFGGTIAHGYLTLALLPHFVGQLIQLPPDLVRLNYGLNKVRFPAPVRVGQRVRGRGELLGLPKVSSGYQLLGRFTVEIEEQEKPACVAENIVLLT